MNYLVVDTNIIFNALLNLEGNTARFFLYQEKYGIKLITTTYLVGEIEKYSKKLAKKQGITEYEISKLVNEIFEQISFIDPMYYQDSFSIVASEMQKIDPKDTDFVALAHKFGCPLWTNDSKLKQMVTLAKVMNTEDLLSLIRFL